MKKRTIISLLLAVCFSFTFLSIKSSPLRTTQASSQTFVKAKANCLFFKTSNISDTSLENIYFEIPETYFALIISSNSQTFYQVKYSNIIGYVSQDRVKIVSFTPTKPEPDKLTFSIKPDAGTQLRSTPKIDNTNTTCSLPSSTQNLTYIARISAEVPTDGSSSIWIYCEYCPEYSPTKIYYGYVYSERITGLEAIPQNTEDDANPEQTIANNSISPESEFENLEISTLVQSVLIILICLPIVAIFAILLIKHRKTTKTAQDQSKSQKTSVQFFKGKPFKQVKRYKRASPNSPQFSLDELDDENLL